jgi:hypothetical protein
VVVAGRRRSFGFAFGGAGEVTVIGGNVLESGAALGSPEGLGSVDDLGSAGVLAGGVLGEPLGVTCDVSVGASCASEQCAPIKMMTSATTARHAIRRPRGGPCPNGDRKRPVLLQSSGAPPVEVVRSTNIPNAYTSLLFDAFLSRSSCRGESEVADARRPDSNPHFRKQEIKSAARCSGPTRGWLLGRGPAKTGGYEHAVNSCFFDVKISRSDARCQAAA